jgi:hypothetical protein
MDGSTNESIFLPLDKSKAEIRLLHLQPRVVAGDEITCTLRLADLDTKDCEYEALSYEWGIATNRIFTVVINEEEVTVRENLWWALWYLRADEGERVIWVDALCIYVDRYRTKYRGKLRLGPLFSEGFRFALVGSIHHS